MTWLACTCFFSIKNLKSQKITIEINKNSDIIITKVKESQS